MIKVKGPAKVNWLLPCVRPLSTKWQCSRMRNECPASCLCTVSCSWPPFPSQEPSVCAQPSHVQMQRILQVTCGTALQMHTLACCCDVPLSFRRLCCHAMLFRPRLQLPQLLSPHRWLDGCCCGGKVGGINGAHLRGGSRGTERVNVSSHLLSGSGATSAARRLATSVSQLSLKRTQRNATQRNAAHTASVEWSQCQAQLSERLQACMYSTT